MDTELLKYKKNLEALDLDLRNLGWVDDSLAEFLIDETECFDDCPEIDRARQLVQAAYDIIKDYQTVQLLWVEEQKDEQTDD
jgi:hypothetical protein